MKLNCQSCGQPMKLVSKKLVLGKERKYNKRVFHCSLCDISEAIHAGWSRDLEYYPLEAKDNIEKMFKQEKENRL